MLILVSFVLFISHPRCRRLTAQSCLLFPGAQVEPVLTTCTAQLLGCSRSPRLCPFTQSTRALSPRSVFPSFPWPRALRDSRIMSFSQTVRSTTRLLSDQSWEKGKEKGMRNLLGNGCSPILTLFIPPMASLSPWVVASRNLCYRQWEKSA